MITKRFIILALFFAAMIPAYGQNDSIENMSSDLTVDLVPPADRPIRPLSDKSKLQDTVDKWDFSLSLGAAVMGGSYGSASLFGIKPTVIYHPNNKLSVKASVSSFDSYSFTNGYYSIRGNTPRSMAPVRYAANALSFDIAAAYQINSRLTVAAAISHWDGALASAAFLNPWMMSGYPMMLNATAYTAAMRYKFGKSSYLDIHMTFIDDREGSFAPLFFANPFRGSYCFPSYFDNCYQTFMP